MRQDEIFRRAELDERARPCASELEDIRARRTRFPWGRVLALHDVGAFTIVEYEARPADNNPDKTRYVKFHVYVAGEDKHESFNTLEDALVGAVAYALNRNVNVARQAAHFATKILRPQVGEQDG